MTDIRLRTQVSATSANVAMAATTLSDNDAKDLLLDGISQAVKALQREHLQAEAFVIANDNVQLQRLCQHVDQVFMCGLYRREQGYWRLVNKMTRQEALHFLDHLPNVRTPLGKGRAWLYLSLNENVLESYLRALPNYGELIVGMYSKDSFLRDSERMFTLTTLITGLDFLTFELMVDSEHFDRFGLLPAATNCSLAFNYTSSSVAATTTFRSIHTPVEEKTDPLASAATAGSSWERFRGIKGYLSDKLATGGGGGSGASTISTISTSSIGGTNSTGSMASSKDEVATSPPTAAAAAPTGGASSAGDSNVSHSFTSSFSSLKSMASRWTSSHEAGLSRPDHKDIAAVCPGGQKPKEGLAFMSTSPSTGAGAELGSPESASVFPMSPDSSANTIALAQDGAEQGRLITGQESTSPHLTRAGDGNQAAATTPAFYGSPPSSPPSSAGDTSMLHSDRQQPMAWDGGHALSQTATPAVPVPSSRDEADGGSGWQPSASKHQSASSVDRPVVGSVTSERDLTASVEGSFTSSGTFKTKSSSRRIDFGKEYVESVVTTPSSGHEFEKSVDDGDDDDVEVIQLSRKTKKGKKKKKKPSMAVIASPRQITEEEETSSATVQRNTYSSGDAVDGGLSSRGMFASQLIEQQRQQLHAAHALSSSVAAASSPTVSTEDAHTPSIAELVASSESSAAASLSNSPPSLRRTPPASKQPPATGATPSRSRVSPDAMRKDSSSLKTSPAGKATVGSVSAAVPISIEPSQDLSAEDESEATTLTPPRSVSPVRKSIYDDFLSEAVSSSPVHDSVSQSEVQAMPSSPDPVPVSDINDINDDIISSPQARARANTSSSMFAEYEESDFAKAAGTSAPRSGLLQSRPSETVAAETEAAESLGITDAAMSSRAPVAPDSIARPASTRSNLSSHSSHSRTSLPGDSTQARSSAPSPGSQSGKSSGSRSGRTSVPSDAESSSSRGYRSSSRGNPSSSSPAMLHARSKTATPSSMVTNGSGEALAVVDLSMALGQDAEEDADMLPALQRSKEALLEERSYPVPERPSLADAEANAHDMTADHNLQLMLSLKIFKVSSNESLVKMMRVQVSAGRGKFKVSMAVLSNHAFYLMNMDGTEGKYNRELCYPYRNVDHIEISLSWQTLTIVCKNLIDERTLITGNEPVTRGLIKALIRAAQSSGARAPRVNVQDRERLRLLERHIEGMENDEENDSGFTVVGSADNDFRVLRYSIVHWEQLDGKESQSLFATSTAVVMEGPITYKQTMVGISYWSEGYAVLKNGTFFLYAGEDAEAPTVFIQLWGTHCGGCRRLNVPDHQNCFEVKSTTESLTLSVEKEADLMSWLQGICEVVAGTMGSSAQAQCVQCSIVITPNKLYCYQEDFWGGPLHLLSACDVSEVTTVFVDEDVRTYCTVAFGLTFESGSWLLCFDCEYELGQFETALSTAWMDMFKIPLTFAPIGEGPARERARDAVTLAAGRFCRSDSVTRGRT